MAELVMSAALIAGAIWSTTFAIRAGESMIEGGRSHLADAAVE